MSNPLLGFVTDEHEAPKDVQDNIDRSSKKVKGNNHMMVEEDQRTNTDMAMNMSKSREGEGKGDQRLTTARTYRATVLGTDGPLKDQLGTNILVSSDEEELDDYEDDENSITVEEMQVAGHDCPIFHLSKKEELRIQKPWKRGIIVKMLGRRIGYKALENRLKQMWVKAVNGASDERRKNTEAKQGEGSGNRETGPWTVVSKPRRQRKQTKPVEENKGETTNMGSRFAILGENQNDQDGEIPIENDEELDSNATNFEVVNTLGETSEESNVVIMEGGGEKATCDVIMVQESVQSPNLPRPPDKPITLSGDMSYNSQFVGDMTLESEVFEDANDQGSIGSMEADMEIINETPRL
ncbi:hypothetical protein TSUD_83860 [Trifolium subterraneum]|uniref:DUF4283 domain-containing protein n=1 Tax=Trifolium subterraneum TaxID=3900 RepID=A0A2Z6LXB5_TRISU|nr:hypothetical protein TSUD_83860 [Trifolium subterraneum]